MENKQTNVNCGITNMLEEQNDLIIYKDKNGNVVFDAIYRDETLWLT